MYHYCREEHEREVVSLVLWRSGTQIALIHNTVTACSQKRLTKLATRGASVASITTTTDVGLLIDAGLSLDIIKCIILVLLKEDFILKNFKLSKEEKKRSFCKWYV